MTTTDVSKSAIFAFQLVKPILQTIKQLIQYTVLHIQFWSVNCTTATVGYAKVSVGNKCNRVKGHGKIYVNDVIKNQISNKNYRV